MIGENMKNIKHCIWLIVLIGLVGCGSGGGTDDNGSQPSTKELQLGETVTNYIATKGEVDTYHLHATEHNRFLHVNCEERTSGSKVDLLVTVFENKNGQRTRLFGKHKPDGATLGANLDLWIYIDQPKDIYITVRDLMDDDANGDIPYYLKVTFEDSAQGNHDFTNAVPLVIDGPSQVDTIDEEDQGQADCFTFSPDANGVYSVKVIHNKPNGVSPVQLAISLYDGEGNRIQRIADPYHVLLAYLTQAAGPYYLAVEDNDNQHVDAQATYDISVSSVVANEAQDNDVVDDAILLQADGQNSFTAAGAIDYSCSSITPGHAADFDWYRLSIGGSGGATNQFVQFSIDNGQTVAGTTPLRVVLYNSSMEVVTSQDFQTGGAAYQNQCKVKNGEYFISVTPANPKRLDQGTNYRIGLQLVDLNDPAEDADDNTANTALMLDTAPSMDGLVSYQSDVDWYGLTVTTTSPQILSVDLTSAASIVDYQLSIWRGVDMVKKVADLDGSDGNTHLKTSVLVPADGSGTAVYTFKVCDAQNNEGSNVPYTITAEAVPVAGAPADIAATGTKTPLYYSETEVEPNALADIELEIFSNLQPHFKANTTWLDFRSGTATDVTVTSQTDGTSIVTFPWVSGYVDYQGDRDFFQIDLGKLGDGTETSWYYDIKIQLVVPAPGSEVEYTWKLYRDSNLNGIIMDDPTSPDGYKACAGDTTPQTTAPVNLITPTGNETFWIGSEYGTNAKFYLGISDFNYLKLPETNDDNSENDDDWGYDAPYYFTVTLTYHPGQAHPD
jgi:hypothetical protein